MKRFCPRCKKRTMKSFGMIRCGPRGGLRKVFRCEICGYQSMR